MSKKSDNEEKLLAETFHGDWTEGPAAGFARNAAAAARRRQRMRRAAVTSGAAAGMAAAVLVSLFHRPGPNVVAPLSHPAHPAYEIISDDELLARVHDRPLLVVTREDGTKQILALGE